MNDSEIYKINSILESLKIKATCISCNKKDNYFYFDIKLQSCGKVKDIIKFTDEISLALKTSGKPSVKILHSQGIVRLEYAIQSNNTLKLFDLFTNKNVPKGDLVCLLGKNVEGKKIWMDLATNPHLLIAGTTGSGKSILIHNIIANLANYNKCSLFLIDPKRIEFSDYAQLPFVKNISYSYNEALNIIQSLYDVMELRYNLLRENKNIELDPIVIIIDEFADLILQDKEEVFYNILCRLAQKCRAAKMHIILSTQRPSVNIINGTIKANFPARIACKVASKIDSKVIFDACGAESLLGKGDALLKDNSRNYERLQIAYASPKETCLYFGKK